MSSTSTRLANPRTMGIFEPFHQISMWDETFKVNIGPNADVSTILQVEAKIDNNNMSEYASPDSLGPSTNAQEENITPDKVQRRQAQNREAARKSRLRKKAYVQQLETSRLKLAQLEQELGRARQQGLYTGGSLETGHSGLSATVNPGIAAFEMEYGHWIEEQQKRNMELRNVLQAHVSDVELRMLVESSLNQYNDLFRMKADAAKADVFYLMCGMWRTSVERFFLWIGGFRPSELVKVVMPHLEPLTDQQLLDVNNLHQSSQQAEDALTQGMEKLQHTLSLSITFDPMGAVSYGSQMVSAIERLEALESFVNQADHLRQQTLQQMYRILTTRQAARGLLALGEYFQRLRALSSLWAARPHEPA